ncbi:AIPR family protein [Pontibacter sp. Tf4]|uniref:AIPR family protein n=1 Tax=Pontibacter sp. Tf4 TaxID=2761620 RepID=UPI001628A12C|nr:AIPR family protein [Pontibacter sp. Tf4]MBB6611782.1 AIPR family protein [Pontibacter sp. Tf4]
MVVDEYLKYRRDLLEESKDEDGFISESAFLSIVLPSMLEVKLVDSEDSHDSYYTHEAEKLKINAYAVNESGERLQLFIVNEDSVNPGTPESALLISQKAYYENHFSRATRFVNRAVKGYLNDEIQDSSPVKALISHLATSEGADQFDVVEIFLLSATPTVSFRGSEPEPRRMEFEDDKITFSYTKGREKFKKELLVIRRLIDLNFLYNVLISQGNREELVIDFKETFDYRIEAIKAADENNFESYLCVLPAAILADLYKRYSSRLLEKNVRSFLQFRGVNKGIKETIRKNPEKFIAYNNGLTITSTGKEIIEENGKTYIKSLSNFQIVNGGQTTATIYFSRKEGLDVSKVRVMAKINVAKEATEDELEDLISNISTFSNAQSRVSKVDLRSRSTQLVKLKALSDSIVTPKGNKWFFERAKGEFNTILRIAGSNHNRIRKEYPPERRFSKEQLAKYYSTWGDQPYMVKKGGEKVFRYFIEQITGEGRNKKAAEIDREFYEDLISRIILFRRLEQLYGQGPNSMGQLRSAVIPYSVSVLFQYSGQHRKGTRFNLSKIWSQEGLGDNLESFMKELMVLMNGLIKRYSKSDDFGEYSKKQELWDSIKNCAEIKTFMASDNASKILEEFAIADKIPVSRKKEAADIDFTLLIESVRIHRNTADFYRAIRSKIGDGLKPGEANRLSSIISKLENARDLEEEEILFESRLLNRLRKETPEIFDQVAYQPSDDFKVTLDFIIREYNKAVSASKRLDDHFNNIAELAQARKASYYSSFREIGKILTNRNLPTIELISAASDYVMRITSAK